VKLLAIDIGGTFTDLHLLDTEEGEARIHKVSTTADDPARGAMRGIRELLGQAANAPEAVDYVLHGTTIATNAVLKHEGASTGMITTEKYRDILHIGRHQRPQNYSVQQEIPWQARPLVRRRHRKTVAERLAPPDGEVLVALDEEAVRRAARELGDAGVEAVAVCFLFSYLNDAHERRAAEIVREVLPEAFVTTSSEVHPQFREFERFTTTAMNAFVGPEVARYVERFGSDLAELGLERELHVMKSNGGVGTVRSVKRRPVSLLYSGPAAGVLGGRWRSSLYAEDEPVNAITLDMGGTSADVGIVSRGEPVEANVRETEIGGYPVMIPMIEVGTIGAGGGSVAYVDPGGAFRVGPRSAGADPGPACYGRGGEEPTVTDAHLLLGRIRPDFFLGGAMELVAERSRAALEERLARTLEMEVREAALGVLRIVDTHMANAIRARTIQKGRDPAHFTLVAFGGAGPMHGASLARKLRVKRLLIPPSPGVLSAAGLSTTDLQYDRVATEFTTTDRVEPSALAARYRELVERAREQLRADGFPEHEMRFELTADCRYVGQGYELNVPAGTPDRVAEPSALRRRFDEAHRVEFGHHFPSNPVEIVNERVTAYGRMPPPRALPVPEAGGPAADHVLRVEEVCFPDPSGAPQLLPTPFYDRSGLGAGHRFDGPAVVVENDATTVVPPDFRVRVLRFGDLELTERG